MAEEIVRIIKVDTKNSGKSIKDLRNEIKALRTELEKTEVGSEEFSAALKKLTQTQKEYNSVQQQVRDMSKTNQQNMVQFASFARNLGKAYSSLNAAIGLFADKNEDVQRAMLRVQRTIQLVQGLDGIAGLVRDIPKVLAGFKNWFTALDPVERQVNNIVKGINGVDPAKVRSITEANRLAAEAAKAPTTTATVAGGVQQQYLPAQTEELKAQAKTYYPALLEQERSLLQQRKQALSNLTEQKAKLEANQKILKETERLYNDVSSTMQLINASDLTDTEKITTFNDRMKELGHTLQIDEFNMQAFTNQYAELSTEVKNNGVAFNENKATLAEIDKQLAATRKGIIEAEAGMTGFQKALAKTGVVGKTAFTMIKTALASIGIGLLISALTAAGAALVKYIKNLNEAAREQKQLNKEINQTTNQIASKQIVVLKELAIAYGKVGDSAKAKEQFLVDYKDKIKETGIAINDVKVAEDVFINNTDKYVKAIMARAEAQAIESKAIDLYKEYLDERYDLEQKLIESNQRIANQNAAGADASLYTYGYNSNSLQKTSDDIARQIFELDEKIKKRLEDMFKDVAGLQKTYEGIFGSIKVEPPKDDPKYKEWLAEKEKDLETLKKATEDAIKVWRDDQTNEIDAVKEKYDELIALAKKYNQDSSFLELTREREIQKIVDKYKQQALDDQKKKIDEQYQLIQTEIERIRKMSDTSNLRQPQEYEYKTHYQRPALEGLFFDDAMLRKMGVPGFATGTNWWSLYQSKEDVEDQLKALVEYNDRVYLLTKQRIEQENKKLNEQLNIVGLDADKRLEIERTLAENEMALSDAKIANEEANTQAFLDAQEKRREALISVLDVASTSLNAMSSIFRTEAQIHQTESQDLTKSQKEREDAAKKMESAMQAYKAFAITQAIVDTWKSANEAYAAMASIPYVGPALGIAASAAAVISGMANVRAIMSESMTSQSQSSSVTAPSAMQAPPIEYTRSLVGDKELDEINQPIRCYVLESDISKTQNKVKVTEANATF